MENNQKFEEFTSHKTDKDRVKILYFDIPEVSAVEGAASNGAMSRDWSDTDESPGQFIGPVSVVKEVELTELGNIDIKKLAAELLISDVPDNQISNLSIDMKEIPEHLSDSEVREVVSRKVWTRCNMASYYVATNGRIGLINTVIANENTAASYMLKEYVATLYEKLKLVINEHIPNDTIYGVRNGVLEEPGYKFLYNDVDGVVERFAMFGVGFFPAKQAFKINIKCN